MGRSKQKCHFDSHKKSIMFKSLLLISFAFATITTVQALKCYRFPNNLESSKGKVSPKSSDDFIQEVCGEGVTRCFKADENATVSYTDDNRQADSIQTQEFPKVTYGCDSKNYTIKGDCQNGVCVCSENLCNKLELKTNSAPSEKFNVLTIFTCLFVAFSKIVF